MEQLDLDTVIARGMAAQAHVGEKLKAYGMVIVELKNPEFLAMLREEARRVSARDGLVCMDTLRHFAVAHGLKPTHPNAFGAVFKGKGWRCMGRRNSAWPDAHGREVKLWRWVGTA